MSEMKVPIFQPMGVQQDNWPAAVGIFTGILAKEAVVGTMNSLYETMAAEENAKAEGDDAKEGEEEEEENAAEETAAEAADEDVDLDFNLDDDLDDFDMDLGDDLAGVDLDDSDNVPDDNE